MPETIILLLIFVFIIINIPFIIIFNKKFLNDYKAKTILNFSIIIAAKNEEENIPALINSLQKINYPKENFEVIIVDDNSIDKTFETIKSLIKDLPNFSLLKVEEKKFPAKKGALDLGIKKAKNPFILITDADCQPETDWLNSYNSKFNEGYDFLFGIAPFFQNNSLVNKISCYENLRSSILTITAAEFQIPYSASARNFGFKKTSFEKINGFTNINETLSGDDDLLLREAVKNKLRTGTVLGNNSFVYSSAKKTFKEYFNQRARHTKTSLHYLPLQKFVLGFWHLLNLFFLFSPFLIFIDFSFIILFLVKLLVDIIVISSAKEKLKYKFSFFEIIYLQIFYELFLIFHFINALLKEDKWK